MRSTLVAYKLLEGFKAPRICVELDQALYRLRDSLALWYQDINLRLKKLKLISCKEELYIFINKHYKIIIMFYINNVLVLYYKNYKRDALALIARLNIAYKIYLLEEIK